MLDPRPFALVPALSALFALAPSAPAAGADRPLRELIDAQVRAAWQREKVTPAPRCDDAAFLRRVHLDLVGTVPTADEAAAFLRDADPQKRGKLVDRLLADPRFAQQQATVWDLVLFGRHPAGYDATRRRDGFKKWLTDQWARGVPYDRWVRQLLLAEEEGPETFHIQFQNAPAEATVAVSRIFLGTQLQCARCHDHPFESWTQRDFYGMAGFFVRLVILDASAGGKKRYFLAEKSTGEVLFSGAAKDERPGKKGEPVRPKFLGGAELEEPALPKDFKEPEMKVKDGKPPPKPAFSRKEKLAAWLTAPDNPWFARAAVNRVWAQYLGRGIVHPVDDLGGKNAPSHPELLEEMARQLIARQFDLRWLIRELVNSEVYQLAATGPTTDALPRWFERARVRPLSAEELLASIRTATGADAAGLKTGGDLIEYMLMYFGDPTNGLGEFQGSLREHLFLDNSYQLRQMLQRHKGNLADALLTSTAPWEERVDRLFLAVLSRPPRAEERARFVAHLKSDPKPEPLVEEAIWALLNTAEFRFNH